MRAIAGNGPVTISIVSTFLSMSGTDHDRSGQRTWPHNLNDTVMPTV